MDIEKTIKIAKASKKPLMPIRKRFLLYKKEFQFFLDDNRF
jgi:hypothetical protein